MIEYEAVLMREEHLKASRIPAADMSAVLDAAASVAEPVRLAFLWRPALRDPADDMVLETAANGRADCLVTFNRRDFAAIAPRHGVAVLSPGDAVTRLGERS
jgi:predicted nucleic acid-binding protein